MTALWALVAGMFTGWQKWLWIGGAAVLLLVGAWLRYEQVLGQRDLARAQSATKDQEIARLADANAANLRTIETIKAEKAASERAQANEAATRRTIESTLAQWKERLAHVPQPACPVGDSDRALLDGVRDILARSAPAGPGGDR